MTPAEQQTVIDLALKKIPEEDFLRRFGIQRADGGKFALTILEKAYREKAAVDEIGQKACYARVFADFAPVQRGYTMVLCFPAKEPPLPDPELIAELRKMLGFILPMSTTCGIAFGLHRAEALQCTGFSLIALLPHKDTKECLHSC